MRRIIATAKTVERATEIGCEKLGLDREQVTVEIIEMPVKKFFKSIPAKVRVTAIEEAEPQVEEVTKKEAIPEIEQVIQKEIVTEEPKQEKTQENKPKRKNRVLPSEPEVEIDITQNELAAAAVEYILSIFTPLGIEDVTIKVYQQGDATLFRISEDVLSSIISINGDTIQALSYLVDRAINKGIDKNSHEYMHVRMDISGYRDKRELELVELANKVGAEVNRTHRSKTLQPMNSYERLIVHTAISQMDGLFSESIGRDNERRVVIKSTADDATNGGEWKTNYRGRNNQNRSRGNYQGRNNTERNYNKKSNYSQTPRREYTNKSATNGQPIVPKTRDAINDGDELPLYGKIEL